MIQNVSHKVFKALQTINVDELTKCSCKELRPVLPCLVRMSLISSQDTTEACAYRRKVILMLLSGIESVNSIVALLSIEFNEVEQFIKEQQLKLKTNGGKPDFGLNNLQHGLALEFERSDSSRRLRLVLCELLELQHQINEINQSSNRGGTNEFLIKQNDLFDHSVYLGEICDVICVALAELPSQFHINEIIEILLHVKYGPNIITAIVANFPFSFRDVCINLIQKSDNDEVNCRMRMQALLLLCQMNPSYSLMVRQKCTELNRLPALAVQLTLQNFNSLSYSKFSLDNQDIDIVPFISGLLLSNDQSIRNWFTLFVRTGQKRKGECHTALQQLRDELLKRLQQLLNTTENERLSNDNVIQASALLRLYCALRGIAGVKYQDDEVNLIIQLITCKPPATPSGVRFVSIGLCMLLACPALLSQPEHERKGIEWVQWLVKEEAYFACASGVTASFGEMLLLMAIHFHSGQLSAVCELVCSTLGMRVPTRQNNMARMKQIFTQEIFTEQIVASHAIKVPVTLNLNANIPGFLSVHCIYQLLKSRAFSKHKVPIKKWIFKQICNASSPLHPILPSLIDVFVNSILLPNISKSSTVNVEHQTNEPISEVEIRYVFQKSVFGKYFDSRKKFTLDSSETMHLNEEDYEKINQKISEEVGEVKDSLTSQLLLLYYLLHYEDIRMCNIHVTYEKKIKCYSSEFLSTLPIKYLLQQAQKDQANYVSIFSPLLRLLSTHFPHLVLVDDWIDDALNQSSEHSNALVISEESLQDAFEEIETSPYKICNLLKKMLKKRPIDIWPLVDIFIENLRAVLSENVPRHAQELYKDVWLRLNTVLPRCLWIKTIAALHENSYRRNLHTDQKNILVDPLEVLRCDMRVFRCSPILTIVLRVLQACLVASKSQLSGILLDEVANEAGNKPTNLNEAEKEEIKEALIATQESATVQILLEACMEIEEDRAKPGQIFALREIRSLICSYLHQLFISNPQLAKLVHFQGYPRELLFVTVPGIPSMHICLDWIPELLSCPSTEKQIFAIDLVSHLSLQFALPKSLSVARLAINTLTTLLGVLQADTRTELFLPTLPALVRIAEAFPPLVEEIINLLTLLGRVCKSLASLQNNQVDSISQLICDEIKKTFKLISKKAVLKNKIY